MKVRRNRDKSERPKSSGKNNFRKLRFQQLEPRLCLDDDAIANPIAHFNEDQAEFTSLLSGQVPNLAQQSDAQVGPQGSSPAQVGQWGPLQNGRLNSSKR